MTDVLDWLLAGDPAVRWQTLHDLTDAPADEVAAARAEVPTTGWGARLLALADDHGWARGACFPGRDWEPPADVVGDPTAQPWTSTYPTLRLLRAMGVDPATSRVRAVLADVDANVRWEYDDLPFFGGEVEPCINGGTVAVGAYFGRPVDGIVARLLGEQLADGGWNCEAENGSVRSSFHTTLCVLDGLAEYRRQGGRLDVAAAVARGHEYLLARRLMRRLGTGDVVDPAFVEFSFPTQWHYDVLWALDHLRAAGVAPDPRVAEAVELVRAKRQPDGRWLLENTHPGRQHFWLEDGDGQPSRWNTLRALRVLRWAERGRPVGPGR